MKTLIKFVPLVMLAASSMAQDEPIALNDTQKEEVIEALKNLMNANSSRKMQIIKAGIAAITPASQDESFAMSLFEKCYKQKEFTEQEKKDKEWREWKTNNKEQLGSAANKRALKYQARWALITLQAAMEPEDAYDPTKYAPQAISLLTEILMDSKVLEESTSPYNTSMITNQIGQVYELGSCRPQGWPGNIMDPMSVFEPLVLAPAREKGDTAALRAGWNNLIAMQKKRIEAMEKKEQNAAINSQGGGRGGFERRGPGGRRNNDNSLENMYWMCELDCYRIGDELNASTNMVNIIRRTKDARRQEMLIDAMTQLLRGEAEQNADGPRRGPYGGFMGVRPQRNTTQQPLAQQAAQPAPAAAPAPTGPISTAPIMGERITPTPAATPAPEAAPSKPSAPRVQEVTE